MDRPGGLTVRKDIVAQWAEKRLRTGFPGERLPTTRALARELGVSARAVIDGLRPLVEAGKLVRVPGRGTCIAPANVDPSVATSPKSSPEEVAEKIHSAICTGEFRVGDNLPSVKFFSLSLHVSPHTVIRAYRILAGKGFAYKVGKQYRVGSFEGVVRGTSSRQVYVFLHSDDDFPESDTLRGAYRLMARELSRFGRTPVFAPVAAFSEVAQDWKGDHTSPAGVVFHGVTDALWDSISPAVLPALTKNLAPDARCVVDCRYGVLRDLPRGAFVVSRGNIVTTGSRAIAAFLLSKRVQSAAFFCDEDRPEGLWGLAHMLRLNRELKKLAPRFDYALVTRPYVKGFDPRTYVDYLLADPAFGITPDNISWSYGFDSPDQLRSALTATRDLREHFFAMKDRPVWVLNNNETASAALDWCSRQRLRVPGRISILSLENRFASVFRNFSHLDMQIDRVGYLMAHAIIGDIPIERTDRGFIRTRAEIVERTTT